MIQVENLTKTYRKRHGEVRALDRVTLEASDGEFLAVRGPSGSGKTTLLLTLGGMIRPTQGRCSVLGTDLYALSGGARAQFRARHVGFVFQMFHLIPYLSVLDNVLVPAVQFGRADAAARARELLERFGLGSRMDHRVAELSTGERQRTAIARALINRPELILADEPTGNLDPDTGRGILDCLADFHRQGGTVVVVTHEPWVEQYASRTLLLRAGAIQTPA